MSEVPVLRRGDDGDDVRSLQEQLTTMGFQPGAIDGRFGGNTEAAVERCQVRNGLSVTGVADHDVWAALASGWPAEDPQSEAHAAAVDAWEQEEDTRRFGVEIESATIAGDTLYCGVRVTGSVPVQPGHLSCYFCLWQQDVTTPLHQIDYVCPEVLYQDQTYMFEFQLPDVLSHGNMYRADLTADFAGEQAYRALDFELGPHGLQVLA